MRTGRQSARDKELRGERIEFRMWKRWRRERLEALLAGPYGDTARALLTHLKTMTTPSTLLAFIKAGPWSEAGDDVRFEILALVDAIVTKYREKMGLAPFDDALPGQPDNLFLLLRQHLAPPTGADSGLIREKTST
jgi:hypothetical protein